MMTPRRFLMLASLVWMSQGPVLAEAPALPAEDKEPVLHLEPGGPTSYVTAVAFSPTGDTLYAAGFDKVVRVWQRDKTTGRWGLQPNSAYRVRIGPGDEGHINAMAVSADGTWLAVGGVGVVRQGAGFRQPGVILPRLGVMTDAMWEDQGTVYAFNTRTQAVHL